MTYPDIEPRILEEWQEITTLIAASCHVPSALVMRRNQRTMEVMSGSEHPASPYKAHETAPLNEELYCETVIKTQRPLHVPNALHDPDWDHNPDIELGMISYYGVPVNWPDGEPFGTLCILDRVEKSATYPEQQLIKRFGRVLELTLDLVASAHELERKNTKLAEAMATIKTISGIFPLCAWCHHQIKDDSGEWTQLERFIEHRTDAKISHGICPECQKGLLGTLATQGT